MTAAATIARHRLDCQEGRHEPLMVVGRDGSRVPLCLTLSVDNIAMVEQRFCVHCRLAYWHELTVARLEVLP